MTGKGRGWDGERREERGERGVGFAKGIVLPRGKSAVLVCEFVGEDIYMQRQICCNSSRNKGKQSKTEDTPFI